jgi:hypothetical protein
VPMRPRWFWWWRSFWGCARGLAGIWSRSARAEIDEEREREQIKRPEEKRPGKGREREKEGGERNRKSTGDGRKSEGWLLRSVHTIAEKKNGLAIDIEDIPSLPSELRSPC